jgi:hypothetical protein
VGGQEPKRYSKLGRGRLGHELGALSGDARDTHGRSERGGGKRRLSSGACARTTAATTVSRATATTFFTASSQLGEDGLDAE